MYICMSEGSSETLGEKSQKLKQPRATIIDVSPRHHFVKPVE